MLIWGSRSNIVCFLYTQQMAAHIINKQKLTAMPRSFKHYIGHDIKAFGNDTV